MKLFFKTRKSDNVVCQTQSRPFTEPSKDYDLYYYYDNVEGNVISGGTYDGTYFTPQLVDSTKVDAFNSARDSYFDSGMTTTLRWKRCVIGDQITRLTDDDWELLLADFG